jgi:hypothetical protein
VLDSFTKLWTPFAIIHVGEAFSIIDNLRPGYAFQLLLATSRKRLPAASSLLNVAGGIWRNADRLIGGPRLDGNFGLFDRQQMVTFYGWEEMSHKENLPQNLDLRMGCCLSAGKCHKDSQDQVASCCSSGSSEAERVSRTSRPTRVPMRPTGSSNCYGRHYRQLFRVLPQFNA